MYGFFQRMPEDGPPRTIVVARFRTTPEAMDCKAIIDSRFAEIQAAVDDLFLKQRGEAHASDLAAVYARFGFSNEAGWEMDTPVMADGQELALAVPPGARLEDIENLLLNLGAKDIQTYVDNAESEAWQMFQHPFLMPLPDDEEDDHSGDDSEEPASIPGRLLH